MLRCQQGRILLPLTAIGARGLGAGDRFFFCWDLHTIGLALEKFLSNFLFQMPCGASKYPSTTFLLFIPLFYPAKRQQNHNRLIISCHHITDERDGADRIVLKYPYRSFLKKTALFLPRNNTAGYFIMDLSEKFRTKAYDFIQIGRNIT